MTQTFQAEIINLRRTVTVSFRVDAGFWYFDRSASSEQSPLLHIVWELQRPFMRGKGHARNI